MKDCCTILLQRNLPDVTNKIGNLILKNSGDVTDFYVVESGTDDDKLSKFADSTFHANWDDARKNGLRTGRGFNFGLSELDKIGKKYKYYFLVTGDTVFDQKNTVNILLDEMNNNPRMGILTPLSLKWGNEFKFLWNKNKTAYVTLVPHVAWMIRSELIDIISESYEKSYMGYLYDGENFRCYDADTEILVKCYESNFYAAITSKACITEDVLLTDRNHEVMKTDRKEIHKKLMFDEGMAWLKKKYNFIGKAPMRNLLQSSYRNFLYRNQGLEII